MFKVIIYRNAFMASGNFISYIRISPAQQAGNEFVFETQMKAILEYLNGGKWHLISEYIEIEDSRNCERPKLSAAVRACQTTGATLIIAQMDRLAHNATFIRKLLDSGIDFVAVDFPQANRLTAHLLAAAAEHASRAKGEKIRAALAAIKAQGKKLGSPRNNLAPLHQQKGSIAGNHARIRQADVFAMRLKPVIEQYQTEGLNLTQIARALNNANILTARGKTGTWTPQAVKNVLGRTIEMNAD